MCQYLIYNSQQTKLYICIIILLCIGRIAINVHVTRSNSFLFLSINIEHSASNGNTKGSIPKLVSQGLKVFDKAKWLKIAGFC